MMFLELHKNNIEKKEEIERLKKANIDHVCTVKANVCLIDEVNRVAHKTNIETGIKYSTLLLFPIIGFSLFYSLMKSKKNVMIIFIILFILLSLLQFYLNIVRIAE